MYINEFHTSHNFILSYFELTIKVNKNNFNYRTDAVKLVCFVLRNPSTYSFLQLSVKYIVLSSNCNENPHIVCKMECKLQDEYIRHTYTDADTINRFLSAALLKIEKSFYFIDTFFECKRKVCSILFCCVCNVTDSKKKYARLRAYMRSQLDFNVFFLIAFKRQNAQL